jgi:hypothetical protein
MKHHTESTEVATDERIESVTNQFGAHAFAIVAFYVFAATIVKSFLLDINPLYYWDTMIAVGIASGYLIVRMSRAGIVTDPEVYIGKSSTIIFGICSLANVT